MIHAHVVNQSVVDVRKPGRPWPRAVTITSVTCTSPNMPGLDIPGRLESGSRAMFVPTRRESLASTDTAGCTTLRGPQ